MKVYVRYSSFTPVMLQDPDTTTWIPENEALIEYQTVLAEVAAGDATIEDAP
jgi:hypothetical protein